MSEAVVHMGVDVISHLLRQELEKGSLKIKSFIYSHYQHYLSLSKSVYHKLNISSFNFMFK